MAETLQGTLVELQGVSPVVSKLFDRNLRTEDPINEFQYTITSYSLLIFRLKQGPLKPFYSHCKRLGWFEQMHYLPTRTLTK